MHCLNKLITVRTEVSRMNSLSKLIEMAHRDRTIVTDRFGNSYLFIDKRRLFTLRDCPPYETYSVAISVIRGQSNGILSMLFRKMQTWHIFGIDTTKTPCIPREITHQINTGAVVLVCLGK